jgi:hypothetical protein
MAERGVEMRVDKWLKRLALVALIFVLTGFGISAWEKIASQSVQAFNKWQYNQTVATKAYWEKDYWLHHPKVSKRTDASLEDMSE